VLTSPQRWLTRTLRIPRLAPTVHDVGAGENLAGQRHDLFERLACAGTLERRRRDHGDRLRVVELQPMLPALVRYLGEHVDEQLVEFSRCQMY
jgi:hypothetical protein